MRISDWSSDVCSSDLHDEQDRNQVIAHVELHARVLERGETTFVRGQFFGGRALGPEEVADQDQGDDDARGNDQEQQNGRAECRERGCQSVSISEGPESLKKKSRRHNITSDTNL